MFYLLTTPQPVPRILSYIAGIVLVNFVGGVLLLAGAQTIIANFFAGLNGETLYGLGLLLGAGLLIFGLWFKVTAPTNTTARKPRSLKPIHTFILGGVVMINELTTALPYFVAIERIAQAQLSIFGNLLSLALYNVIFSLPLLGFLGAFLALQQRFTAQLERISQGVQLWSLRILKYGSIAFGAFLMLNATSYFGTGAGLFG
jgi:cytochrome c biogenesis protein CcdA